MKLILTTMLLGALLCLSCANHPDVKLLVGSYSYNIFSKDSKRDSLYLNSNYTYKHVFHTTDNRIVQSSGNWEYDSLGGEVLFKNFQFFDESGSSEFPPGNWYSSVTVTKNGEVRLIYSSENNVYFSKKSTK
jgi:hypothetical protein